MPIRLCIPATEAAKSHFTDEADQILFLQGFRWGAEMAVAGSLRGLVLDESQTPSKTGFRYAIAALGPGGPLQSKVGLLDFGYSMFEWKQGLLVLGHEQSSFTPDGEKTPYWVVFRDSLQDRIPRTGSSGVRVWMKAWLSPEGMYGHMGQARRQLSVIDFYELSASAEEAKPPRKK
jgi:hypothetical protein